MGRPGWPSFGVQPGNGNGRRGRPAGGGSRFRSSTGPREAYASQEKGRKEREKRFLQSKRCLPARALGRGGVGGLGPRLGRGSEPAWRARARYPHQKP